MPKKINSLYSIFGVFFPSYFVYLLTVFPTVGTEDSGELATSAITLDIAHPSGYPLHTLLGHLFTWLIPFGNMAWRTNLLSVFFGAATITLLYLIIKKLTRSEIIALGVALFTAFTDIYWSEAIRTAVHTTFNTFFLLAIIYSLIKWDETEKNRYLHIAWLMLGLGLSNHHMTGLIIPAIILFTVIRNWRKVLQPKIIIINILMIILGLLPYAYLPIRTSIEPAYDNPAYIEHEPLNTPESFIKFINRSIYGNTFSLPTNQSTQASSSPLIKTVFAVTEAIGEKIEKMIIHNKDGFIPMNQEISKQLFYLPIFFFIPGLYFLFRKNPKTGLLMGTAYLCYTVIQLIFIYVSTNLNPYTEFGNRPFYMCAILLVAIISSAGIAFLFEQLSSRIALGIATIILVLMPLLPLGIFFYYNNESHNLVAYDFNKNLLASIPTNGYLLSTGRDNLTFPLYYLRKVEKFRTDVDLEIYYRKECVSEKYLQSKMKEKNKDVVFLDLLPCEYSKIPFITHNFVYAYGTPEGLTSLPASQTNFVLHGLRPKMDYMNNKVKGWYYLKMATIHAKNSALLEQYFSKIHQETPELQQYQDFIRDYLSGIFWVGMF